MLYLGSWVSILHVHVRLYNIYLTSVLFTCNSMYIIHVDIMNLFLTDNSLTGRTNAPHSPLLSPPIPSSLSPLPTTLGGVMYRSHQPSTTANDRAIHSGTVPVITTTNIRGLPTTTGSSITPPPALKLKVDATSTTTVPGISSRSQITAQPAPPVIATVSSGGFSVAEIKSGGCGQVGVAKGEVKTSTTSTGKLKDTELAQNLEK